MASVKDLYRRLLATSFPRLGGLVGNFLLYDSALAGLASSVAKGVSIDEVAAHVEADRETLQALARIRSSKDRTKDEQEFLDYFELLEEIRSAVLAAARRR